MEFSRKMLIPLFIILIVVSGFGNNNSYHSKQLYEAINNNNVKKVQQILESTKLAKLSEKGQMSPEVSAATLDEYEITKAIVKAGGSWKSKDINGNNLLHISAMNGNKKMLAFLLNEKKVNINMTNSMGMTPLLLAIAPSASQPNRAKIVEWFIQKGADPGVQSKEGFTALHIAAQQNQPDVITYLIQFNELINMKDTKGRTALIIAVQSGNVRSVKELLNGGSNQLLTDNEGKTAKLYAEEYGLKDIGEILK